MAIFEARTPWGFTDGLSHCLFVDSRLVIIIKAIHERKRTRLCEPEWKTRPWTKHVKSPRHALLDIMVDLPGLLEGIDKVSEVDDAEKMKERCSRLLDSCWICDKVLMRWYDTLRPAAVTTTDDTLLLYWTTCLYLYSSMNLLKKKLGNDRALQMPERVTNLHQYIYSIAEAIPVFYEDSVPRGQAIFPLGVCLQFMQLLESSATHMDVDHSGLCLVPQQMMQDRQRLLTAVAKTAHGKAVLAFLSSLSKHAP